MRPSLLASFRPAFARLGRLITTVVLGLLLCMALVAQNRVFSTHDHTLSIPGTEPVIYPETWADAKMPGGFPATQFSASIPPTPDTRRTYVVGTIGVSDTLAGVFSIFSALPPPGLGFPSMVPLQRQVAMLQCNDAANAIKWQRYFYGSTPGTDPFPIRATNARGISVWAAHDEGDTRIAICGETYDKVLPLSQTSLGWTAANASNPSGFIAVYDGAGTLLWTHHFFAGLDPLADCAITDVSIRVDAAGNDVVTYCGISSHGLLAGGTDLSPLLPFTAPPGGCTGGAAALPAVVQWDGIVGRLKRPPGGPTARVFHS